MHPGVFFYWHGHRGGAGDCGDSNSFGSCGGRRANHGCGSGEEGRDFSGHDFGDGEGGGGGGGSFGVRRPLRFLAWKLDLDERQVSELARILNELKTERAQGEVDHRRTVTAFADAVAGDAFDSAKLRVESAQRLRDAVLKALQEIHGILSAEQRAKLAYLIRTGTLSI